MLVCNSDYLLRVSARPDQTIIAAAIKFDSDDSVRLTACVLIASNTHCK